MKRAFHFVVVAVLAGEAFVIGRARDVNKILADVRQALGGEKKLAGVRTLTATGRSTRVVDETTSAPTDFEFALELPDKFVKRETLAMVAGLTITRTSGFNGDEVIEAVDRPPQMGGAMVVIRRPGDGPPGVTPTPEQRAATRKAALLSNKQDCTRLLLGMLATSLAWFPVQFADGGQAESPDGKADLIDVKGEAGFAARLFVDTKSHLPLMLSWMAREPMIITNRVGGPGGTARSGAGGGQPRGQLTPEDIDEMRKQAEAQLKVVEYRLYYGDYQDVDGVRVPFHLQRSIAGKPVEDLTLETVKVNTKIDPQKFDVRSAGT